MPTRQTLVVRNEYEKDIKVFFDRTGKLSGEQRERI